MQKDQLLEVLKTSIKATKEKFPTNPNLNNFAQEQFLDEFGQRNLGEFLGYLGEIYLVESSDNFEGASRVFFQAEIFNLIEYLDHTLNLDNDTLQSRQFFHYFLLEFNQQRAKKESENGQEIKEEHKFAIQQLLRYKEAGEDLISDRNDDITDSIKIGNSHLFYSETIGQREAKGKDKQEDALLIGAAKNDGDWQDSSKVPHLLKNKFEELGIKIRNHNAKNNEKSGSTAIINHYSNDQKLTIANLGDSRSVLFIKKPNGTFTFKRLTNDHEPGDILEKSRIVMNDGFLSSKDCRVNDEMVTIHRVNGNLNLSRSFGDINLEGIDVEGNLNGVKLISYQPDIYQYDIAEILKNESEGSQLFLMTCCDGLFDHGISNEAVYAEALELWFRSEETQAKWSNNCAEFLRDCATALDSSDNITVCFSEITQAPEITILTGVFDGHSGNKISSVVTEFFTQTLLNKNTENFVAHYQADDSSVETATNDINRISTEEVIRYKDINSPSEALEIPDLIPPSSVNASESHKQFDEEEFLKEVFEKNLLGNRGLEITRNGNGEIRFSPKTSISSPHKTDANLFNSQQTTKNEL